MPEFGPSQYSVHVEILGLHTLAPNGASALMSVLHGLACSPSFMIISTTPSIIKYLKYIEGAPKGLLKKRIEIYTFVFFNILENFYNYFMIYNFFDIIIIL